MTLACPRTRTTRPPNSSFKRTHCLKFEFYYHPLDVQHKKLKYGNHDHRLILYHPYQILQYALHQQQLKWLLERRLTLPEHQSFTDNIADNRIILWIELNLFIELNYYELLAL